MKLSEAIRVGAKYKRQTFHSFYNSGGSCALGAAIDGVTYGRLEIFLLTTCKDKMFFDRAMREILPFLQVQCNCSPFGLFDLYSFHTVKKHIVYLNDTCRWSREAIADWVAKEEEDYLEALELNKAMNETIDAINTGLAGHVGSADTVLAETETRKELSLV